MWSRPHVTQVGGLAGAIATLLLAACSDSPTGPGATSPLVFEYFIHPKVIGTEPGQLVRAGTFAGPNLCWQVGAAWIRASADSLYLEGTAIGRSQGACATALSYDTLSAALPGLDPGLYFIVAGDLVDTLYVLSASEPTIASPAGGSFAAHGRVISSSLIPEECTTFECRGPFVEVSGAIENPPAPLPGNPPGRATGDFLDGAVHCGQNDLLQRIHLRSFEPGPSYGDTRNCSGTMLSSFASRRSHQGNTSWSLRISATRWSRQRQRRALRVSTSRPTAPSVHRSAPAAVARRPSSRRELASRPSRAISSTRYPFSNASRWCSRARSSTASRARASSGR